MIVGTVAYAVQRMSASFALSSSWLTLMYGRFLTKSTPFADSLHGAANPGINITRKPFMPIALSTFT
jgi:hypothetical protein